MGNPFDEVREFVEDATGLNTSNNSASDRALAAQQDAANQANATQRYIFDTTRADNQPWQQAGVRALAQMENPEFQRNFTMADFQADPGYAFRMQEGQKALARASSASGLFSSGTMKSLANFNSGLASQEYDKAFNRFESGQTNRFNRLASLANVGQTANAANQNAGQNYANQFGENTMGAANAQAAQSIAQANQRNSMYGQAMQNIANGLRFSDVRLKENIELVSKEDLQELKATLKPYRFTYKDQAHGEGDYIGVMAQDLEKSKLGRTLVTENEQGFKQIDLGKVMCLFLATLAEG